MAFHIARRWSWLLVLGPLWGCGTHDLRSTITQHKVKVEAQLAKLGKIRDAARTAPPVSSDNVTITGPAPKIGVTDIDEHANVAIEYLEDLDDTAALSNVQFRILGSGSMNRCGAILTTHRYPYNPASSAIPDEIPWYVADEHLKHCAAVRYIFVIRSLAYAAPSLLRENSTSSLCPKPMRLKPLGSADAGAPDAGAADAESATTEKCPTFDGGYLQADVLVYDLENGQQLGGFRFIAENSSQIDVAGSSPREFRLFDDFSNQIRSAFTEAARKSVPGFTVGY